MLMAITILPFISIFTTALHPSGTVPNGLAWPASPQWGNFVEAFKVANMTALLASSTFIVIGGGANCIDHLDDGSVCHWSSANPRFARASVPVCVWIDAAFWGIIVPLYYLERSMGIYNTRFAIVLPLIGLVHALCRLLDARPLRQHASRNFGGGPCRWRDHLGFVLAHPRPARAGADRVTRDPHVRLDVEPVSPCAGAGRGPDGANDGRCAGSIPGPLRDQCSLCCAPVRS